MVEEAIALRASDKDNVATVFAEGVTDGSRVVVLDAAGSREAMTVIGNIPYGHKFALRAIAAGELIIKYGEEIGAATHDIRAGEYVHVHNLESLRGRGDLERGK